MGRRLRGCLAPEHLPRRFRLRVSLAQKMLDSPVVMAREMGQQSTGSRTRSQAWALPRRGGLRLGPLGMGPTEDRHQDGHRRGRGAGCHVPPEGGRPAGSDDQDVNGQVTGATGGRLQVAKREDDRHRRRPARPEAWSSGFSLTMRWPAVEVCALQNERFLSTAFPTTRTWNSKANGLFFTPTTPPTVVTAGMNLL